MEESVGKLPETVGGEVGWTTEGWGDAGPKSYETNALP